MRDEAEHRTLTLAHKEAYHVNKEGHGTAWIKGALLYSSLGSYGMTEADKAASRCLTVNCFVAHGVRPLSLPFGVISESNPHLPYPGGDLKTAAGNAAPRKSRLQVSSLVREAGELSIDRWHPNESL